MTLFTDCKVEQGGESSSPRVKVRMFQQMAEALEDEAAVLYRRAAAYEEEDFLLDCEINERQTEINRLKLKLESMRSDRDGLLRKIEAIRNEAAALREEAFNGEEEIALAAIDNQSANQAEDKTSHDSLFFRRMTLADAR